MTYTVILPNGATLTMLPPGISEGAETADQRQFVREREPRRDDTFDQNYLSCRAWYRYKRARRAK